MVRLPSGMVLELNKREMSDQPGSVGGEFVHPLSVAWGSMVGGSAGCGAALVRAVGAQPTSAAECVGNFVCEPYNHALVGREEEYGGKQGRWNRG